DLAAGEEERVRFQNKRSVPDTNNPNPDPDPTPTPTPTPTPNPTPGSTIVVTKRDATTQAPIDTATFQLWQDANANGRLDATLDTKVGTAKNTANGVVSWVSLTVGTYFVAETVAPKGYELPDNTVLTIAVDATMAGKTLSRSFYDPQKTTKVEVVKQDDHTHEVLAGATFQAYADEDEDGLVSDGDAPVGDPQLTDENGVVSWSGLGFGHYVVEEVAPPAGYGLPTTTTMPVVLDRNNAGGTVRLVFLDPALGTVSIAKVALELDATGEWVASDGEVEFGDRVKYVLTATASGPKVFQAVEVTDIIPGYDPADRMSTTETSYVDGSARCVAVACATSFDAASQQLTWSLGELRDQQRSMEFIVLMPDLPAEPVFIDGELIETIANVADLSWREGASAADAARTIRSNEVVTTIAERPLVLDTPPADRPEPGEKPEQGLPETGAPHNSGLITTVGSLSLLLGAWLMLTSRRRGFLPQH
ncbi:MAG TPA: SpaA isopeptide-forming pilin-related protein, partial [Nocardioidaceae bacterium]|nr:SpaA isopeptide-forming pilin-related protein [Nocardioidaceae bacterium]